MQCRRLHVFVLFQLVAVVNLAAFILPQTSLCLEVEQEVVNLL